MQALGGYVLGPHRAHDNFRDVVIVEQHDGAVLHVQKRGQQVEDIRQGRLEPRRLGKDLRDLVDADQPNLTQLLGLGRQRLGAGGLFHRRHVTAS